MPELDVNDPHRANTARRWNPAVRDRDYVYRGQGHDIYEDPKASDDPRVVKMVEAALEAEGFHA